MVVALIFKLFLAQCSISIHPGNVVFSGGVETEHSQLAFTCSKSATEILGKGVKYIQS